MNFLIDLLTDLTEYIIGILKYLKPKYLHIEMQDPDTKELYEHRYLVHFLVFTAFLSFVSVPELTRIQIVLKILKWDAGILFSKHDNVRQYELF